MRELTVAMVMTKDPVTVAPDTEFKDIVEILPSIRSVPSRWSAVTVCRSGWCPNRTSSASRRCRRRRP